VSSAACARPRKQSAAAAAKEEPSEKALEEVYQRKTPVEHVLLRPDSYVGSTQRTTQELWVLSSSDRVADGSSHPKAVLRECGYVPALYKIFDEILVNAADNKQRYG
jgi:DNA topoisomerase-2